MIEKLEKLKTEALELESKKDSMSEKEFDEKLNTITNELVKTMEEVLSLIEKTK